MTSPDQRSTRSAPAARSASTRGPVPAGPGWSFAFSKRWAGYLALVIVFALVCCALGAWQLARRAEARVEIDRVAANFDHTPVPIDQALPTLDAFDEDDKWLPVTVTGTYLVDEQVLVRNRPLNGNPGFEVITPLELANGDIFIVDRGWLPTGSGQDSPDSIPAPPAGEVTVSARLKAGEPTLPGRGAPEGQIATIQLDDLRKTLDEPTYTGAYGLLASESPAPAEAAPVGVTRPTPDEGPHLSYSFQWFVFAILGFFGFGWAVRQEYRNLNADDPEERIRADERARKKAIAQAESDNEVEDAILGSGR
jgi:cytochrome oxidase assembly protein ShyY1